MNRRSFTVGTVDEELITTFRELKTKMGKVRKRRRLDGTFDKRLEPATNEEVLFRLLQLGLEEAERIQNDPTILKATVVRKNTDFIKAAYEGSLWNPEPEAQSEYNDGRPDYPADPDGCSYRAGDEI